MHCTALFCSIGVAAATSRSAAGSKLPYICLRRSAAYQDGLTVTSLPVTSICAAGREALTCALIWSRHQKIEVNQTIRNSESNAYTAAVLQA